MSTPTMPDSLVNSLVKNKSSGEVKRVIRDDGENGLFLSPEDNPVMMEHIDRALFREDWELFATVSQQLKEVKVLPQREQPFRDEPEEFVVQGVNLASQVTLPTIDSRNGVDTMTRREMFGSLSRDPFGGRATPAERPDADTSGAIADETLTGDPVGGNEEPASEFEEDRADPDPTDPSPAQVKAEKKAARLAAKEE